MNIQVLPGCQRQCRYTHDGIINGSSFLRSSSCKLESLRLLLIGGLAGEGVLLVFWAWIGFICNALGYFQARSSTNYIAESKTYSRQNEPTLKDSNRRIWTEGLGLKSRGFRIQGLGSFEFETEVRSPSKIEERRVQPRGFR